MSLKSSAFLALVGMILLTVLIAADFVTVLSGVLRDLVPPMKLLASIVYLFAGLAVTLFFYAFHRAQS
jgi:hypothetical protein